MDGEKPSDMLTGQIMWCLSEFADLAAILGEIKSDADKVGREAQS